MAGTEPSEIDLKTSYLAGLGTAEALKRLRALVDDLFRVEPDLAANQRLASLLEKAMEDRDLELAMEPGVAEGKNEQERKGRLVQVRRGDKLRVGLAKDQDAVLGHVARLGSEASKLRREWGYLQTFLRLRTAQIYFLGGSDDTSEA